jgi:hypothetical protein
VITKLKGDREGILNDQSEIDKEQAGMNMHIWLSRHMDNTYRVENGQEVLRRDLYKRSSMEACMR